MPLGGRLLLIFLTILMSQLSISALNDWADRVPDGAAGRRRPVPLGLVSPATAMGLAVLFAFGTVPGLVAFGTIPGLVLLLGLASGWAYDLWLKPTALSFLPFAVAFPLLPTWVGLIGGRSLRDFLWVLIAGVFLATAIHLADSLPDISVDAASGQRTLAVRLGLQGTIIAIVTCLAIGGLVTIVATSRRSLLVGTLVFAALAATLWVVLGARWPQRIRWVAGGFAVLAAGVLIGALPSG